MKTYLQLNSSLHGAESLSSRLAGRFIETLVRIDRSTDSTAGSARVVVRDLARQPLPHLTAERFTAFGTAPEQRTAGQAHIAAESDALVAELAAADVIVIGLPMYNFGVPSTLKAYFDHVARAGVTFRYTADGPEGLLRDKRALVVATRGGRHAGTPSDLQSAYVRQFLGFIGITDVEFIYAEGLAMGEESRTAAIAEAGKRIEQLAA
ncbi:MAG: NAD(P)H-dependent oxidoreductase [Proteobacteria bacterium]|nr:NAD(P)H-dependent oxidoreductase [Pseudomonadota bacterium]